MWHPGSYPRERLRKLKAKAIATGKGVRLAFRIMSSALTQDNSVAQKHLTDVQKFLAFPYAPTGSYIWRLRLYLSQEMLNDSGKEFYNDDFIKRIQELKKDNDRKIERYRFTIEGLAALMFAIFFGYSFSGKFPVIGEIATNVYGLLDVLCVLILLVGSLMFDVVTKKMIVGEIIISYLFARFGPERLDVGAYSYDLLRAAPFHTKLQLGDIALMNKRFTVPTIERSISFLTALIYLPLMFIAFYIYGYVLLHPSFGLLTVIFITSYLCIIVSRFLALISLVINRPPNDWQVLP